MLNKNDPLIGAVQEVMKRNHAEREAAKVVNETFGIADRKALPHERQHEWDAAYKQVLSEGKITHPNQQVLNVHEPEKDELTSDDFRKLRAMRAKKKPVSEQMKDPNSRDVTSPSDAGIEKPDYAKGTPDYAKPKTQTVNRAEKTSLPAGTLAKTMKEEEQLDELKGYRSKKGQKLLTRVQKRATDRLVKATDPMWTSKSGMSDKDKKTAKRNSDVARMADDRINEEHLNEKSPPGRADQVETLKKKFPEKTAFQIAWSSYNKSKKKKKLEENLTGGKAMPAPSRPNMSPLGKGVLPSRPNMSPLGKGMK